MIDGFEMSPQRRLVPLEETGLDIEFLVGLPEQEIKATPEGISDFLDNDQMTADKKISVDNLYPTLDALTGEDTEKARYVYDKSKLLGAGGFAFAYRGIDRLTGKKIAAKSVLRDEQDLTQREAEIMAAISENDYLREHIVPVMDVQKIKINNAENTIVIEEYMDGLTRPLLEESKMRLEDLSVEKKMMLIEQLCKSVDIMAKNYDLYHRDLSPYNIFVNFDQTQAIIGDFGASSFARDIEKSGVMTNFGWCSPEMNEYSSGETDKVPGLISEVYTVAVISYFILTNGSTPYPDRTRPEDRTAIKSKVNDGIITHFLPKSKELLAEVTGEELPPEVVERIAVIMEKGMAVNSNDRYGGCEAFFIDLKKAISGDIDDIEEITSFIRN